MSYVKNGDVSIAYSTIGDGPFDVVFVPGWILSVFESAWDGPAAETLRRLASFSRVILFDKRGTGLSDRASGIPDFETRMDDIRAVMDAVGSERAALLGVSEGGPMTLLFAATYPERTAAAILYGAGASWVRADDYPWAPTPEEWQQVIDEDLDGFGSPEWLDAYLEGFSPSIADDEEMKLWWRKWVLSSSSPGALQALRRTNSGIDVRHVLSSISAPTLVLHPVDDEVMELGGGEYIASHVPGAELIRLPGAEHGWWVRGEEIGEHSERFLREVWDRGEWDVVEPTACSRPFSSPTSSARRRNWSSSATAVGATCSPSTTRGCGDSSYGFAGKSSTPPGTASSPRSTGRHALSAVPARSSTRCATSASRFEQGSTRANASRSTARSAGSPSTSAHASPRRPGRVR